MKKNDKWFILAALATIANGILYYHSPSMLGIIGTGLGLFAMAIFSVHR